MLKTAHKNFPWTLLGEACLQRGEWQFCTTEMIDRTNLQVVRFVYLQAKGFISTCSKTIPGLTRKTKHHGLVQHPQVAEQYLEHAAAIDVHNHFRSGSCALEDVWHTKKPRCRQFAGILEFCFTNGYLAMKHFSDSSLPHFKFKMTAAAALTT